MNLFSIRDIENLTGIKAHTLRIWEQRYNLFCPKRKESKHRFYDNEDLKFLLRVAHLYNQGIKISQIAAYSHEEISKMVLEVKPDVDNFEIFINQLTEASLDFDQARFEKVLHNLILHAGFEKSMNCVLFPMLKKMGLLWLAGGVVPAQQNFATALISKKLMMAIDGLEKPVYKGGRRVLLFTPSGEHHEIPLLYMQYLLKKQGISYLYLGKNISLSMLQEACTGQPVTQLYFHMITNLTKCDMYTYLEQLSELFPDKEIVFSGSDVCQCSCNLSNVRLLKCSDEKLCFVKEDCK